jgi:superfamily II DNA/RNA helicase
LPSSALGEVTPIASFTDLGLSSAQLQVLHRRGITEPLPIQAAIIPDALAGRDVSGMAPTGSGKTLAFALPMAALVARGLPRRPRGLVLAPTRELASQIAAELAPFLAIRNLKVHPIFGGVAFNPQRRALQHGVDVVVACPGRLEDLMRMGEVVLSDVDIAVVDEADRMADMGFLPAVRRILDATNSRRQTMLFSATLDDESVRPLVRNYQRQPVRHDVVSSVEEIGRATHRFRTVAASERAAMCAEVVKGESSTIVFVRTKHGADRLARQLGNSGLAVAAIHGGHSQPQRDRTLAAFRAGKVRALVATDVAARGVHVDDVSCVVHYDLPPDPKDYLHRSGRTARAGAAGSVVAFVSPDQRQAAAALARALDLDVGTPRNNSPAPLRHDRPKRRRAPYTR